MRTSHGVKSALEQVTEREGRDLVSRQVIGSAGRILVVIEYKEAG